MFVLFYLICSVHVNPELLVSVSKCIQIYQSVILFRGTPFGTTLIWQTWPGGREGLNLALSDRSLWSTCFTLVRTYCHHHHHHYHNYHQHHCHNYHHHHCHNYHHLIIIITTVIIIITTMIIIIIIITIAKSEKNKILFL